jgi:hypothetical protein
MPAPMLDAVMEDNGDEVVFTVYTEEAEVAIHEWGLGLADEWSDDYTTFRCHPFFGLALRDEMVASGLVVGHAK